MITEKAYAKINLTLRITGRRPDGYHELESVMQKISLCDTLTLEKIPRGIELSCTDPVLACDERNLCCKAAKAYFATAGIAGGVKMHLEKQIPMEAGLGGGSADAAAVLRGLSRLYPADLDLNRIAAEMGADVPFCLHSATAFCAGIGERLRKIPFFGKESLFVVVAKNAAGLPTPLVYSLFDQEERTQNAPGSGSMIAALEQGDFQKIQESLFNDLEAVSLKERSEIAECKEIMRVFGAERPMMTGSGAAVFALFSNELAARHCAEALRSENIFAALCTLL